MRALHLEVPGPAEKWALKWQPCFPTHQLPVAARNSNSIPSLVHVIASGATTECSKEKGPQMNSFVWLSSPMERVSCENEFFRSALWHQGNAGPHFLNGSKIRARTAERYHRWLCCCKRHAEEGRKIVKLTCLFLEGHWSKIKQDSRRTYSE